MENMELFGLPEYCVTTLHDDSPLPEEMVHLNLEKAEIKYIKNILELEGNTASERDILFLTSNSFKSLEFDSVLGPKDIEEVYAMKKAIDFLIQKHKEPLTADFLFMYNYLVVIDPKKRLAGRLRETNVWINGTTWRPPGFEMIPRLFDHMFSAVDVISGNKNKAVSYLLGISRNQFFIDGNKRTARLAALHQLAYGRQPLLSPTIDTVKYLKSLLEFYETGNKDEFVGLFESNLFSL